MPVRSDYHLHSSFSADCAASMDDQIRAAIAAGMESVCFTEHVDLDSPFANAPADDPESAFLIDYKNYRETFLLEKSRYAGQIRLFFGVELGLNASLAPRLSAYLKEHTAFDFVIGSTHSSRGMDPYYSSFFEGIDAWEAYRRYFADALRNIRAFSDFDSYGHLDYVLRYGPAPADGTWIPRGGSAGDTDMIRRDSTYYYECFADLIDPILCELILRGKALEVNTAPLKKGFPEPNPGKAILKKYHDFGGRLVTVGADAHVPEGVAFGFERAAALLKECGFSQYATFENRRPVLHDL